MVFIYIYKKPANTVLKLNICYTFKEKKKCNFNGYMEIVLDMS